MNPYVTVAMLAVKFVIFLVIIYYINKYYTIYLEEHVRYITEKAVSKPSSQFANKHFSKEFLKKAKKIHDSNNKYNVRKTDIYNMAKKRAFLTKKPLMVIGDPMNGSALNRTYNYPVYGTPYGYGDVCIDLSGCPENPGPGISIKSKLENVIGNFDSSSHVIFISQTLEYIDPKYLNYTLKELIRVSKGDLFIVDMNYEADTYSDRFGTFTRKTYFTKVPPYDNEIEYYFVNNKNKKYTINLNSI
jgi:hypothetical protein